MKGQYEVMNPWADVDPLALKGISPRPSELAGKTIGLYSTVRKRASLPINKVVEARLKERFPTIKISHFLFDELGMSEYDSRARLAEWLKGVDAVVTAVGD